MSGHPLAQVESAPSEFEVHWVLSVPPGQAERFGKVIRHAWWTFGGVAGQRRLICDYAGSAVVVIVQLVADDLYQAIYNSQDHVITPIRRVGLHLPKTAVVIVTNAGRAGS